MKTKEELKALKEEVEALSAKLRELSEEELKQVSGGWCCRDIEIFFDPENGEGEKQGDNVAVFPALPAFS